MTGLPVRGNWLPLTAGVLSANDIKERGGGCEEPSIFSFIILNLKKQTSLKTKNIFYL